MATKTLAKSLHTVTALVKVALHIQSTGNGFISNEAAVAQASTVLGYGVDALDPYGLEAKAVAALKNEHLMGRA